MQVARILSIALLLLGLLPSCVRAQLIMLPPEQPPADLQEGASTPQSLQGRVAAMLLHGDYDAIDQLADKERRRKTRLAGGTWRLRHVYGGLKNRAGSNPEDTIARLKAWIAARPDSITARVALAEEDISYAWAARGGGLADTVTAEGWRLFNVRIADAKRTLDDSAAMSPMCPQWFSAMQTVARAQGWDADRTAALFAQAKQFEPGYFYYYTSYANYLLPKWEGHQGDSASFAKRSADEIPGPEGDFLYFEIGSVVLGSGNGKVYPNQLDWPRLQRGHASLVAQFGGTSNDLNQLALLAYRFRDVDTAKRTFDQIGDKWSKNVWRNRARFDKARDWAQETPLLPAVPTPASMF